MKGISILLLGLLIVIPVSLSANAGSTLSPGTDDIIRHAATKTAPGSRTTIRDNSGRILGTANTVGQNTTVRDNSGRIIGTATVQAGRTVFRDSSGRTVWTVSSSDSQ
jgi:hypothetical protein